MTVSVIKYVNTGKENLNKYGEMVMDGLYAILLYFFFFGCCVLQLDMGSQFPDQGLNSGHSSESAKS